MTREQVLELQKVHTQIYNDTIKPLYEEAKRKEKELKNQFVLALDNYFDTLFIDQNGQIIKVGDTIEVTEHHIESTFENEPVDCWRTESDLLRYSKENISFKKTGKTRTIRYICTKIHIQFLFGDMLNNPRIYVSKLKNGKVLKKEDSFNSEKCKDFKVISKTTNQ